MQGSTIVLISFAYLCVLFAIAYYGDKRADQGRSLIANPYIYSLSLAVYCTSWTFYGSVGRAATSGVSFLPIYLGPTLVFILGWLLIRKIIRISKVNRITSIADFIASRYGKSSVLGALVTIVVLVGNMPYISLQLKAVSTSFAVILQYPDIIMPHRLGTTPILQDTALYVALAMAAFAILFGTRHIDASEHHEGMVAAIAFESVVKLLAFLSVGIFVTYWVYDGFGDIFTRAQALRQFSELTTISGTQDYVSWISLTLLSMAAIICLPRQFQVTVVENVDENHLRKAIWLFPLYLFLINIFVLPIAFGGLLHFPAGDVDADTFVITVPMAEHQPALAMFAFLGGLSAATAMIIVATIATATMVCNDLVMPILLRRDWFGLSRRRDLTGLLLLIRRITIVLVLLLGYAYFRLIGETYALVTIGLVSFVAVTQFAPAMIGGLFWKGATRAGAISGLTGGFVLWLYTLLLPSFAQSGWLPQGFISDGPFAIALLRPYALFGLDGFDIISHALFWTMLANVGLYVGVSVMTSLSIVERTQAAQFVDIFKQPAGGSRIWRGRATVGDLKNLLTRFIGPGRTQAAFRRLEAVSHRHLGDHVPADAEVVSFAERQLAGVIGAASARIMVASVVREEMRDIDEMMEILDEASQVIEYSRQLEEKSSELEAATNELRAANERLKELDRLKDNFVSTVSHELRTPLTSIRSFSEIVHDNPSLDLAQRKEFLGVIVLESERLTRLIDDILDLAKMEAGKLEWHFADIDPKHAIAQALVATSGLFRQHANIRLDTALPDALPPVHADADRLTQVMVNLISNAVKFCDKDESFVRIEAAEENGTVRVTVRDNGRGIARKDHERIFDRFQQAGDSLKEKPMGTGLGLPICKEIIAYFGGQIWLESRLGQGAAFSFRLPVARPKGPRRRRKSARRTEPA